MPVIPLAVCLYQTIAFTSTGTLSLTLLSAAFFLSKTMDYSLRSVVFAMAFQPLDFESRYVGKEVIGVLGSRLGKSGMSIVLSGLTALGLTSNVRSLIHLALGAVSMWFSSTMWLSFLIPSKEKAQAIVKERQKVQEEQKQQQQQEREEPEKKKTN
jgi:ATP:ADP antiporter, AAA family